MKNYKNFWKKIGTQRDGTRPAVPMTSRPVPLRPGNFGSRPVPSRDGTTGTRPVPMRPVPSSIPGKASTVEALLLIYVLTWIKKVENVPR